jgi:hypothetical protein
MSQNPQYPVQPPNPPQPPMAPPPGYVPPGYAPQGYPPQQLGYAGFPQAYYGPNGMTPQQAAKAQSMVRLSNWLGWGGLLMLFIGTPVVGIATESKFLAIAIGVIAVLACGIGAIVGQIGRGMQGRVV